MTYLKYGNYIKTLSFENEVPDSHLQGIKMNSVPLEGLNAHIQYGICSTPGEKGRDAQASYVHNFDALLLFIGLDMDDMTRLGAEIELSLGAEKDKHLFAHSSAVAVPKGCPYFPLNVKKVDSPFLLMEISLTKDWHVDRFISDSTVQEKSTDTHKSRIIELIFRPKADFYGPGTTEDSGGDITIIMGEDLGFDLHIYYESIKKAPYVFGPAPHKGHAHKFEECVLLIGSDPNAPEKLGADAVETMGNEKGDHLITTPVVVIFPKRFPHGPLKITKVEHPFIFMVVSLAAEHHKNESKYGYKK
jgi:hypothetical protein